MHIYEEYYIYNLINYFHMRLYILNIVLLLIKNFL
jgi:hypothetical protein